MLMYLGPRISQTQRVTKMERRRTAVDNEEILLACGLRDLACTG